jgi:hypothetical protein
MAKVYVANFEMYENWSICEDGNSVQDLPDDFYDKDKFFVLKSDYDKTIKTLKSFLISEENANRVHLVDSIVLSNLLKIIDSKSRETLKALCEDL